MTSPAKTALQKTSTVTAATFGSRLLGFARDAGTAAVLGAAPLADALMAALSLPLLARRLLAEGAFNAALIPALAAAPTPEAARRVASSTLLLLSIVLLVLAALGALAMPLLILALAPGFAQGGERADLAVACGRIALLYLPLAGMAAVFGGVANGWNKVLLPALAPMAANGVALTGIAILLVQGILATPQAALVMAAFTVLAGIAQLLLMVMAARGAPAEPALNRAMLRTIDWRAARSVLRASAPALLFAGLSQFRLLGVAAVVSAVPGAVSALNYAQRLVDLPLGLVGASAGAVLVPLLAVGARTSGARDAGREATGAALAALALALPAATGLALLAEPIVTVLYQRASFTAQDTAATAVLLTALAAALPAQGLERVLCATAMSHGLVRPVERIGLLSLFGCVLLALGLGALFGPAGAAAAIAVSASASALAMGRVLVRRGHLRVDDALMRALGPLVAGCLFMAAAVAAAAAGWAAPEAGSLAALSRLAALVGLGMAVFGLVWLAGRRLLRGAA